MHWHVTVLIMVYQDLFADMTEIWDLCDLEFIKLSSLWKSPDNQKSETAYNQFSFQFFIIDPLSVFNCYVDVGTITWMKVSLYFKYFLAFVLCSVRCIWLREYFVLSFHFHALFVFNIIILLQVFWSSSSISPSVTLHVIFK